MARGWGRRGAPDDDGKSHLSRSVGCLIWLAIFVVILVVLAVVFGGFQLGKKAGGLPQPWLAPVTVTPRAT